MTAPGRRVALVAPDKFKGTLGADVVAAALAAGARAAGWAVRELPVADGGEGTAEALLRARGGRRLEVPTTDALGRAVVGAVCLLGDGSVAALDMASASGLWRIAASERDVRAASTAGTGALIAAAVRAGAREVVVAAGGSATVDGGAGALEVLDAAGVAPRLVVACDVRTPWERAPAVFGPQKGASVADVAALEERLDLLAARAPRDPRGVPMTGAAGGLSGGLWAWRGAALEPGAPFVLDALGFDDALAEADVVLTGEGRIDAQTAEGKAVGEVAARCAAAGVPCVAVVGADGLGAEGGRAIGLRLIVEAGSPDAIAAAAERVLRAR